MIALKILLFPVKLVFKACVWLLVDILRIISVFYGVLKNYICASEIHGTDRPIKLTAEPGVFPTEEELAALDVLFDKAVEDSASSKPQKDEKTKPSSIKDKLAKGESKKSEAAKTKAEIAKDSASKTKEAVIA